MLTSRSSETSLPDSTWRRYSDLMRIDYEISEQDFLAGQRLATRKSHLRAVRWTRRVIPVFGGSLLVVTIFSYATRTQEFSTQFMPPVIMGLLCISLPLIFRRAQRKNYAKSTAIHGRQSLDADDDGLRFQGPMHSSQVLWSLYCKFFEDNDSFVLLQQNQQIGNIIPKRNLTPEEIAGLRDLFNRRIVKTG